MIPRFRLSAGRSEDVEVVVLKGCEPRVNRSSENVPNVWELPLHRGDCNHTEDRLKEYSNA
jgi:hypothetical protein